jgi:hypothetical protein
MKAIPTRYAGITFRSRLEADWAATFDHYNIAWRYEPEGYQLSSGDWYSPDFYLADVRAWVEVKGEGVPGVGKVERFAADLWDEYDATTPPEAASRGTATDHEAPMVLIGGPPHIGRGLPHPQMNYIGVRAPGHRYSAITARCASCHRTGWIALWAKRCRACGAELPLDDEQWFDQMYDPEHYRFIQLPRPAGGAA